MKIQAGYYWFKPDNFGGRITPAPGWEVVCVSNYAPESLRSSEDEESWISRCGSDYTEPLYRAVARGGELGERVER